LPEFPLVKALPDCFSDMNHVGILFWKKITMVIKQVNAMTSRQLEHIEPSDFVERHLIIINVTLYCNKCILFLPFRKTSFQLKAQ
jgi:hypothetical protein